MRVRWVLLSWLAQNTNSSEPSSETSSLSFPSPNTLKRLLESTHNVLAGWQVAGEVNIRHLDADLLHCGAILGCLQSIQLANGLLHNKQDYCSTGWQGLGLSF